MQIAEVNTVPSYSIFKGQIAMTIVFAMLLDSLLYRPRPMKVLQSAVPETSSLKFINVQLSDKKYDPCSLAASKATLNL